MIYIYILLTSLCTFQQAVPGASGQAAIFCATLRFRFGEPEVQPHGRFVGLTDDC